MNIGDSDISKKIANESLCDRPLGETDRTCGLQNKYDNYNAKRKQAY